MKKLTPEEFDERLEERVNRILGAFSNLQTLIDQRPDLYTRDKHDKVFAFLLATVNSNQALAAKAIDISVSRATPFSIDAPPLTPPIPQGRMSKHSPDYSNGQPTTDDGLDDVDFIEE